MVSRQLIKGGIKQMEYKEEVEEAIEDNYSLEELAFDLYKREDNYNNTDVTSGQTCKTEGEILIELETTADLLREDSDHCSECGARHRDDSFMTVSQTHEFWGAPVEETFVVGYKCPFCGEEETY